MTYKESIKQSMILLDNDPKRLFIGYGVKYGGKGGGTLSNINPEKLIETPLAENLMAGLSIGLSIEGYNPVLYIERFDFILNALDAIVNHLDKFKIISNNQYKPKVIIRTCIGRKLTPFLTGPTHTQDLTSAMKKLVTFPILRPITSNQIIDCYKMAMNYNDSVLIIEELDLYDIDF